MFQSAKPFFQPKTVAIVGASETGGGGWPRAIYKNLEFANFPAKVYLINPRRDELWGQKVYPDFSSLPEPIDLALTIIPAEFIPETLADGAKNGLKAALVYAARFGEGGDDVGAERADKLRDLCEDTGLVVCGPNCMGAMSFPANLLFYPAMRIRGLPVGSTGVVFQSGGTFMFWLQRAAERGLDFSYAVSSGNELNLDLADYINFLVEDKDTKMIACMVEGIRRPDAFIEAARKALEAKKPIVMIKVGRSDAGKEAAQSHTGALASDDSVLQAVCRKYGVVRCYTLDEMIETCLVLNQRRWPKGPNIGMAGFSGGGKGLFLDYVADEGAEMGRLSDETVGLIDPIIDPGLSGQNPIDCGAGIAYRQQDYSLVCKHMAADDGVDIVAMQGQLPTTEDDTTDATIFSNVFEATEKPVLAYVRVSQNVSPAGLEFQRATKVPFVQGLSQAVRAIKGLVEYTKAMNKGMKPLPKSNGKRTNLEGSKFEDLITENGLTPPASGFGKTPGDAANEAEKMGYPVVLKIVSPQASHKTEVGGVALNLCDSAAVVTAAIDMETRLKVAEPEAIVEGFLVQEMVSGVEVILGVREDPQFGPFMVVGLGGVLVEAMQDVSFRMLPVLEEDAKEMLGELRGKAILGAFRGAKPRDTEALVKAICGLSDIFASHREFLADLEVNPLIVGAKGEGVRAVDVRPIWR
ncbi:MAG: acetate--CoA ligase family protein [Pseudomonadota bacterium]|nr:acetate--CoA ligase family protein [Pseudomonadota bacterium]